MSMKSIVMPPRKEDFFGDETAYEKAKNEYYSELRECLMEIKAGQAVVSLKNMIRKADGSYSDQQVLIQQHTLSERAEYTVYLNGTEVYLIMRSRDNIELQRVKNLWDIMRHKNTTSVTNGKLPDTILVVDIVRLRLEKGLGYTFSFINPLIITNENSETSNPELQFLFKVENVFFGRETITEDELEYQSMLLQEQEEAENQIATPNIASHPFLDTGNLVGF